MTNNVFNAVVNDFVGDRNGLFRVAGVVIFHANQLIAFNSPFGINVFNRLTRAVKFHIAPLGNRAGHRADNGNFNIVSHSGV